MKQNGIPQPYHPQNNGARRAIIKIPPVLREEHKPKNGKSNPYSEYMVTTVFRPLIQAKAVEVREEIRLLKDRVTSEHEHLRATPAYTMGTECGSDVATQDGTLSELSRQVKFLGCLEAAEGRIRNGTYGICVACGHRIGEGRLKAVPTTRHCINCKT